MIQNNNEVGNHFHFFLSSGLIGTIIYTLLTCKLSENTYNTPFFTNAMDYAMIFFIITLVGYTRAAFSNQPNLMKEVAEMPTFASFMMACFSVLNNNFLFLYEPKVVTSLFYGLLMADGLFYTFRRICQIIKWLFAKYHGEDVQFEFVSY
jgi:hypothetical protein